jgi:hypothetical protein
MPVQNSAVMPQWTSFACVLIRRRVLEKVGLLNDGYFMYFEDVEFCHRLRRAGFRFRMDPQLLVRHSFGFGLTGSLKNAARKVRYWARYSMRNRDLLADSGTASRGLKAAGALAGICWISIAAAAALRLPAMLLPVPLLVLAAIAANFGLVRAFHAAGGPLFAAAAAGYLVLPYPLAIAVGAGQALLDLARKTPLELTIMTMNKESIGEPGGCKAPAGRRGGAEGRSPAAERSEHDGGPQRQDPTARTGTP